ncbi:unnamed protein product (macronuclear) [Paramecium tetraurelia]|uniref:Uncharacterized protein n=1 Tax=Paramecium tetraurelia TaxID=5888 RepID=A0BW63_PARTE|nr:uncharacterized protein GSPATT00032632001 [Paramecium tetraurelia]CAK62780.1 unnamed protein product [Paramecium tetraurelia]|eukprot:XP_001430178.1 hypothetical protein (macronuclear) [Paramecium tetraurelia strain d4-2]
MQKDLDPYKSRPSSPFNYSPLAVIKRDSYFQDYNESAEMREIWEDQEKFQHEYDDMVDIIGNGQEEYKKKFLNEIDVPYDPVGPSEQKENTKIPPEKPELKPIKFKDKSYCRYILLYMFRTIENKQFAGIIRDICSDFSVNYDTFVEYYRQQRILIMGYKALKTELIYENQPLTIQNRKKAFKQVLVWYLDRLATKHILSSKKQNFKEYLKFKNYVMSYYIHNPKSWTGNKPLWKANEN